MSDLITQPVRGIQFVDDGGVLTERNYQIIANLVQLQIIQGSGSPENVISAKTRTLYMDTAGTAGSILYIKRDADISGDTKRGWILV